MKEKIKEKLNFLKAHYSFLSRENDDYIFNALCSIILFYRCQADLPDTQEMKRIIVDGTNDGGIDCILIDPDSDYNDIVFIQCKQYNQKISKNDITAAIDKMYNAYKDLISKQFSYYNSNLVEQYSWCESEMEENARVKFVFCTTAPKSNINLKKIHEEFVQKTDNNANFTLDVFFDDDIAAKIDEYDSLRKSVNSGTVTIDKENNILKFSEDNTETDAIIVNGSANSIKLLYSQHHLALFSHNLRYYIKAKTIDNNIAATISDDKNSFWYKNNGLTIICESFKVEGKVVILKNFSIINGGQTTTLLGKSDSINERNDFYLPIKIISVQGSTEEQKQDFIFKIAVAANSQKPIKPSDMKANAPEQLLFANELKKLGILYKTKRGEKTPSAFSSKEKNTDLKNTVSLGFAGIFLMPGTARNKSSIMYSDDYPYYEKLFGDENRVASAVVIRDLLHISNYFETTFLKDFTSNTPAKNIIIFSNQSKTLCLAFSRFLSLYINKKYSDEDIQFISNVDLENDGELNKFNQVISRDTSKLFGIYNSNTDVKLIDDCLKKSFKFICRKGAETYEIEKNKGYNADESNWLKKDSSFYKIIKKVCGDGQLSEEIDANYEIYKAYLIQ